MTALRSFLVVSMFCLLACSENTPDNSGGGSAGSGGSASDGGSGGGDAAGSGGGAGSSGGSGGDGPDGGSAGGGSGGAAAGSGGSAGGGDKPAIIPFSSVCKGTLKTEQSGTEPYNGSWLFQSSTAPQLPVGTEFMLGRPWSYLSKSTLFIGYLFLPSGEPTKIHEGAMNGLSKETDFTTSCPDGADDVVVLLKSSTFYASKDLSGEACTLPEGTRLSDGPSSYGVGPAEISCGEIKAACGLDKAYSSDLIFGVLLVP